MVLPNVTPLCAQRFGAAGSFFNAAGTGLSSRESVEAARNGEEGWESAIAGVRSRVHQLMGVEEEHVTVFHNTTAGMQRVFLRLGHLLNASATLLTTDVEYPGTIAMADESWSGPMVIAQVADLIWEGRTGEVLEVLRRAFLLARPSVIYLSHIARASGYPLDEAFIDFVREVQPRTVIVMDGAQAVGNVVVDPGLLEKVDFYVTSGHKWLCGQPTLGLVYARPQWKVADPAQSYSRLSGSGGSGSLDTLRSAATVLRDFCSGAGPGESRDRMARIAAHNRSLAEQFQRLLRAEDIQLLPVRRDDSLWPLNGIVAVRGVLDPFLPVVDVSGDVSQAERVQSQGRVMAALVKQEPWVAARGGSARGPRLLVSAEGPTVSWREVRLRADRVTSPVPSGGILRFCFHYFHSTDDVRHLVSRLRYAQETFGVSPPGRVVPSS